LKEEEAPLKQSPEKYLTANVEKAVQEPPPMSCLLLKANAAISVLLFHPRSTFRNYGHALALENHVDWKRKPLGVSCREEGEM